MGALALALASLRRSLKAMGMSPRRFAETSQSRGWDHGMVSVAVAVGNRGWLLQVAGRSCQLHSVTTSRSKPLAYCLYAVSQPLTVTSSGVPGVIGW